MPLQEYIQPELFKSSPFTRSAFAGPTLHLAQRRYCTTIPYKPTHDEHKPKKEGKKKNHVIKLILASSRSLLKYITRIRKYHFQL